MNSSSRFVPYQYFDLNGVKPINDRYGHDMGDEVLKITGRRLLEQVRAMTRRPASGGMNLCWCSPP